MGCNGAGESAIFMTGDQIRVRGEATLGDHVFVHGGVIEGPAPALTGTDIAV